MTKFRKVLTRAALAAAVIGGTAAITTAPASARVVCNYYHCWHVHGYYGDPYYDPYYYPSYYGGPGYYGPGISLGFGFGGGGHWHGGHGGWHGGGHHR